MASCIPFISWAQDLQILGDLRVQQRQKCMAFKAKSLFKHNSVLLFWMTGRDWRSVFLKLPKKSLEISHLRPVTLWWWTAVTSGLNQPPGTNSEGRAYSQAWMRDGFNRNHGFFRAAGPVKDGILQQETQALRGNGAQGEKLVQLIGEFYWPAQCRR